VSERRHDPTTGEWVTFATHRQERTFLPPADSCPLCPDPAGAWDGEIRRPAFEVAVFDNRFPSLQPHPPEPSVAGTDLYPVAPAEGRCEVVVYSSDHATSLSRVGFERVRLLLDVWADRYTVLGSEGLAYVLPFENKGEVIGVTLHHPHGQIYSFTDVPPRPLRELTANARHRRATGRCVECDVAAAELAGGGRVVVAGEQFVAHVPFWARFPYEVRISPRDHLPSFAAADAAARDDLARVLVDVLAGLDALFGFEMPYILGIFAQPTGGDPAAAGWDGDWADISHLHLLISPPYRTATKLKYLAGVESMGGAFMTDVAPEAAAANLRDAVARARG
jgi:UDPglucose--hexose-1-phosphate uridylyltransferase